MLFTELQIHLNPNNISKYLVNIIIISVNIKQKIWFWMKVENS